jgi:hypothetical protein
MEEAGQSMTDGCKCLIIIYNFEKLLIVFFSLNSAPLIKIKKAMENIKVDMKNMDVRIGVLEHILLQSKLRHKDLIHEQKDK